MSGERLMRPDMPAVRQRWSDFWERKNTSPMLWLTALKDGKVEDFLRLNMPYPQKPGDDYRQYARNIMRANEECLDFVGDEVPAVNLSFGPDQFCGFMGQKIEYSEDSSGTSWSVRCEEELEELLPMIRVQKDNPMFAEMLKMHREMAEEFDGRVIIGTLDYHSNWDAVCSLRDPVYASMDMMTCPDTVKQALDLAAKAYGVYFDIFYRAGNMAETGTSCWVNVFCEAKYTTVNCDFITLLGPDQAREFVFPCLEKELEAVDHAIYHLDGYTVNRLLPDILRLPKLRAINYVPGAGAPSDTTTYWLDTYRQILDAGVGVQLFCTPKDALEIHRALRSPNMIYTVNGGITRDVQAFYDEFMSI
ncbi:MAG: hypothetical protein IK083_02955 [Abditibacteriota bacterium]|nr:hypothetical protein [Abditibacteriota bacterium]